MSSRCPVVALLSILCIGASASPQQTSQAPAATQDRGQEKKIEKKEQSRRMLGLPQFTVTDRKNAPPLTPKGKFRLFYKSAFDPAEFVVVGLQAEMNPAQNLFATDRQGAVGIVESSRRSVSDPRSSHLFTS